MNKDAPITASRVARELIAKNKQRKARAASGFQNSARNYGPAGIATRDAAIRKATRKAPPAIKNATTVDEFVAAVGRIERLPDRASGLNKKTEACDSTTATPASHAQSMCNSRGFTHEPHQ